MINEIKKTLAKKEATVKKCNFLLNGNDAYKVTYKNGDEKTFTKPELIAAYKHGGI